MSLKDRRREALLARHLDRFLAFARTRVKDPDVAADALQDAYAKAIAHAGDVRDDESVVAWFYRILRNTLADAARRAGRTRGAEVEFREETLPARWRTEDELCRCLASAIDALPAASAELLRALELKRQPTATVAKRLGITPGNLKVRRHRARKALRAQLAATCGLCAEHGCTNCDCRAHGE